MEDIRSMVTHFSIIQDTRSHINKKHNLEEVIVLVILGIIAGCDSWVEIEYFGNQRINWLKGFLSLKNGIPSHDTLGRVIGLINPRELLNCFKNWVANKLVSTEGRVHVAVDGKTFRATSSSTNKFENYTMVSAFASEQGICLGHVMKDSLKFEKAAFKEVVELMDIKNVIITMDANGLTADIMNTIASGGGEFIIAVKSPNTTLLKQGIDLLEKNTPLVYEEMENKEHGRIEKRKCELVDLDDDFNESFNLARRKNLHDPYPKLTKFIRITSEREVKGVVKKEERYYISNSIKLGAKRGCELIRSHWAVENKLHWVLDVNFKEDRCTVKDKIAAENFGSLRRFVLSLIKLENTPKMSQRVKRKMAGWDENFLLKVAMEAVKA